MNSAEGVCWARRENSIPDSGFFSSVSFLGVPPKPPKEKPAKGLGLTSAFFSSVEGLVAAGVVLLLKEKPPKTDLLSATGVGVPNTVGIIDGVEVPKVEDGVTVELGVD